VNADTTLTAFGLTVEIGDWHRFTAATIGGYLGLTPSEFSSGSSRSQGPAAPCAPAGPPSHPPYAPGPGPPTPACTDAGWRWKPATSGRPSPPSQSPASWPAGAGAWPSWTPDPSKPPPPTPPQPAGGKAGLGHRVRNDPRQFYEQPSAPSGGHARPLDTRPAPDEHPGHAGNQPAHISLTARRHTARDPGLPPAPAHTTPGPVGSDLTRP
jgi:Transposase IS116/IS110/IS902 family